MSWFNDNGFLAGDQYAPGGAVAPALPAVASAPSFDQINAAMLAATGRAETPQEFEQFWKFDPASGADWQTNWQNTIENSPEAQAFRARQGQPMSAMAAPTAVATAPGFPSFTPTPTMAAPTPYTLPTAEDVARMPGYQFTRDQGIQGVLRSDIARGFGIGGAALKDIAQFSTGLADQYYGNRVNQTLAANNLNFGQGLQTNQFNQASNLANFGAQLGAQNQFWNQGFNENRNAFDQYDRSQQSAFDQWYKLAQLGNPGNPYA